MAYNEAANIAGAITSLLNQRVETGSIGELIVVASGCTDNTVPIVEEFCRKDPRVRLLQQERREGKASAINLFIQNAMSPILVMVSADVIVKDGTIEALLRHFQDETVGMVGGHPVPVNDQETFLGHAVHLLWRLHDRIARECPKLGEAVAFRNVLPGIPVDTPVDEISIQALIAALNYRLVYDPEAIVYNRGPATVADYLKQRRRIAAGHFQVRARQGYSAATMSVWRVGRTLFATSDAFATPRATYWTLGTVALEAWARALGAADHRRNRQHYLWQMVDSTKSTIGDESTGHRPHSVVVFRIVDFRRHQLELGSHRAGLLHQAVLRRIRGTLDSSATVSGESSGTIVAVLQRDRTDAERHAQDVIEMIEGSAVQVARDRDPVRVALTCGIVCFLQTGDASALTIARRPVEPAVEAIQPVGATAS